MKIFLLVTTLLLSSSMTFAQKKAKPTPESGEMIIGNFTYAWRASEEARLASVKITCPNKKDSTAFNLELNKPVSFDFKCSNGDFTKGEFKLVDMIFSGLVKYGIFMDAYYGDSQGTAFDMHFEGMMAAWTYEPEPPTPPTPPPVPDKNNTWGVKFEQKRVDDFRQEFK